MKLMIAKKQSAPVAIACIIAATTTAALANNLGSPGSALDPNNYVAPPVSKATIKPAAPAGEPQEETQSTTTFVTMPGFETPGEKPAQPGHQKAAKVKSPGGDDGLLSGMNDKFKEAGSGIASGTKAAGDSMKKGTKAVGEGIASGAKASGSFFMKGFSAIGEGTKKVGSKVAAGAKAAGDTVKDGTHAVADKLPFTGGGKSDKSDKIEAPKALADKPTLKQEDLKPASDGAAEEPKVAAKPAPPPVTTPKNMRLVTEDIGSAKPGLVGKTFGTFGKLNVFHKKNSVETAGKVPSGAAVTH
ncbi:MAG: hypothetical protein JST89_14420 [Cyanobacteria bacterium SZAS-4]|nr:hypothetical protein [Cyanobacteria bacterium SZAS-4]